MPGDEGISKSVASWLRAATEDAERRGLPGLKPMLHALSRSTLALRKADWNEHQRSAGERVGQ
jgi:hypothetical protein